MKFWLITAACVALLAGLAGGVAYACFRPGAPAASSGPPDESLRWLWTEFRPDEGRMQRIAGIHAEYRFVCDRHCADIREARRVLQALERDGAPAGQIAQARIHLAEIDAFCRRSLEAHVRAVAGILGGSDGERYLATVLPRLARFDHQSAPDLRLREGTSDGGTHHH